VRLDSCAVRMQSLSFAVPWARARSVDRAGEGPRRGRNKFGHPRKRWRLQCAISGPVRMAVRGHFYCQAGCAKSYVAQRFLVVYDEPQRPRRYHGISGAAGFHRSTHYDFAGNSGGTSLQPGSQRQQLPGAALRRALGALAIVHCRQSGRQQRPDLLHGGERERSTFRASEPPWPPGRIFSSSRSAQH